MVGMVPMTMMLSLPWAGLWRSAVPRCMEGLRERRAFISEDVRRCATRFSVSSRFDALKFQGRVAFARADSPLGRRGLPAAGKTE